MPTCRFLYFLDKRTVKNLKVDGASVKNVLQKIDQSVVEFEKNGCASTKFLFPSFVDFLLLYPFQSV